MNDWLLFVIGLFVGSTLGVLLTALLSASKTEDLLMEIQDLRTQRKLLKINLHGGGSGASPALYRICSAALQSNGNQ